MTDHDEDMRISRIETMPDWKCAFCGTLNTSNAFSCSHCAKKREDSDAYFFEVNAIEDSPTGSHPPSNHPSLNNESATNIKPLTGSQTERSNLKDANENLTQASRTLVSNEEPAKASHELPKSQTPQKSAVPKILAVLFLVLLVAIPLSVLAVRKSQKNLFKVTETRWERSVVIERYMPKSKKQPQIKAYAPFRTARAEGKNSLPKWPALDLGKSADGKPDKEGRRSEIFTVRMERVKHSDTGPNILTINSAESDFVEVYVFGKVINLGTDKSGALVAPGKNSSIKKTQ